MLKIGFHFKNVKVSKTKEKEGERRKKGAYTGVGGWGGKRGGFITGNDF